MEVFHTLFYFIVAIGLLVSFHEFGHFLIARLTGVKVIRFSVGFGKIIWRYQYSPDATEYALFAIPLGGYVKMVDEREGEVNSEDLPFAFNRQPLWIRTAIVSAGPLFNIFLAVLLFWCVFVIGETGFKPIIGTVESVTLAAKAGFEEGDEILSVNGAVTPTWTEAMGSIVTSSLDSDQEIQVEVHSLTGENFRRDLVIPGEVRQDPDVLFEKLGLHPWSPKLIPVIGKIIENSPASLAGLQIGDQIKTADKQDIMTWMQWVEYVRSHGGQVIHLQVERDGMLLSLNITPASIETDQGTRGRIGAAVQVPEALRESLLVEYSLPPFPALITAMKKTYTFSSVTLKMVGEMLLGNASVKNLSGPISIAQYAGQSAEMGLVQFLKFLAMISISLGIVNLLPIPVLDGGHLMFFAIEAIKGSPVSERVQLYFQQVGFAILISLMGLAVFLDVERLFQ